MTLGKELRKKVYSGLFKLKNIKIDYDLDKISEYKPLELEKKLNKIEPDELKQLSLQTYTDYKKRFIEENGDYKIGDFDLKTYIKRLEYEIFVISKMGFLPYFYVVSDYINRAKRNGIMVGPGRGSAAGSLFSYCLGITDIDPIEYDLLFERFLNPARVSMPDIDTDFEDKRRDDVIKYCEKKYGKKNVGNIITFTKFEGKVAFKDVAKYRFGINDFQYVNNITTKALKGINKLDESLLDEKFKSKWDEDKYGPFSQFEKILKKTLELQGSIRQFGMHACGILISPEPLEDIIPIGLVEEDCKGDKCELGFKIVSGFDGHYIEDVGLLKMDFLGLRNLTIIKNTINNIVNKGIVKEKNKEVFETFLKTMSFNVDLDDKDVYKHIFQNGNTTGVFQFESEGMKQWLKKLKPDNFQDIIAMVALYRPGPMDWIPNYVNRKQGKEEITYLPDNVYKILLEKYGKEVADQQRKQIKEDLSPFMDVTYGIPIYQEQLMKIVQYMAGFSLAEADLLRRGVGKKIKEIIDKLKKEFVDKCKLKGYKEEVSTFVYEKMIEPASNYSFNKSHAVCYAYIAYQTAYLKYHYNIDFLTELINSVQEDAQRFSDLLKKLSNEYDGSYKLLPANIKHSYSYTYNDGKNIYLGYKAIKGLGNIDFGDNKFDTFEDFGLYIIKNSIQGINKTFFDPILSIGAIDEFRGIDLDKKVNGKKLSEYLSENIKNIQQEYNELKTRGGGLFGDNLMLSDDKILEKFSQLKLKAKNIYGTTEFKPLYETYVGINLNKFGKKELDFSQFYIDKEDEEWVKKNLSIKNGIQIGIGKDAFNVVNYKGFINFVEKEKWNNRLFIFYGFIKDLYINFYENGKASIKIELVDLYGNVLRNYINVDNEKDLYKYNFLYKFDSFKVGDFVNIGIYSGVLCGNEKYNNFCINDKWVKVRDNNVVFVNYIYNYKKIKDKRQLLKRLFLVNNLFK